MAKTIRVLHVIGLMNRAGSETMIMNLYRNVDRQRVQFDFVEHGNSKAAYDEEIQSLGGRIYRCPSYTGLNHLSYCRWWDRFFNTYAHDYIAVHGHIGSTATTYLSIAKKYGLFTIAHSHSSGTDHSLEMLVFRLLSRRTKYIADYFFGCSQLAGIDRYGESVANSDHFKVLNNAINTADFVFDPMIRQKMRTEFNLPDDAFVVGHVGRFDRVKNHSFIIEFFERYYQDNKNAWLLLVGDGPLKEKIIAETEHMGIKDHMIFTGVREDVYRILQVMDVFVMPSWYEGLGVALIEAQTAGLPCLVSDKIPDEGKLVKELVKSISITEGTALWVQALHDTVGMKRISRDEIVKAQGYDIKYTADWLTHFYCNIGQGVKKL